MPIYRTCCIVLMMTVLVWPSLGVGAEAPRQAQPTAWLALHSYARVEQRLREIAVLTGTQWLMELSLRVFQFQWGGLRGLDQQRPIGLVLPALDASVEARWALSLPFTDQHALLETLRQVFPVITAQGNLLALRSNHQQVFGRVDPEATVILLSKSRPILRHLDTTLPVGWFAKPASRTDIRWRVNMTAYKIQHQEALRALQDTPEPLAQFVLTFLHDLTVAEGSLALAPDGWVMEVEPQAHPDSDTATFFNQQRHYQSRAMGVSFDGAIARSTGVLRVTDGLRQTLTALLEQSAETTLSAPEFRPLVAMGRQFLAQWLSQSQIEIAAEMHAQEPSGTSLTAWTHIPPETHDLPMTLEAISHFLAAAANTATLSRNVAQYRDTPLHRLEVTSTGASAPSSHNVFFGLHDDTLIAHQGDTIAPLTGALKRVGESTATATPTDALLHVTFSVARWLKAAGLMEAAANPDRSDALPMILALFRNAPTPVVLDVLPQTNAVMVRMAFPEALVKSLANAAKQQILPVLTQLIRRKPQ